MACTVARTRTLPFAAPLKDPHSRLCGGRFFDTDGAGNLTLKGFRQVRADIAKDRALLYLRPAAAAPSFLGQTVIPGCSDALAQMFLMQSSHQPDDTWKDLERLGYTRSLELLRPEAENELTPGELAKARMDALRAALTELKQNQDSAQCHRRVGVALDALGRTEAAQREFAQADVLEGKVNSTVEEID